MSTRGAAGQLPGCTTVVSNPGSAFVRPGLASGKGGPHAPSVVSKLDIRPTELLDTFDRAEPAKRLSTRALRPCHACPEHPCHEENSLETSSRPDAFTFARRLTLVPPLGDPRSAMSRCLETTSTTDVSRHEHPLMRIVVSGDSPPSAQQDHLRDPPTFGVEDVPDAVLPPIVPRTAPDHLAVIQPPAASCLTARRRLRASRPPACFRMGEKAPPPCRQRWLRRSNPLTPLATAKKWNAEAPVFPVRVTVLQPSHVNAPVFLRSRCLPSQGANMDRSCEQPGWRGAPAWPAGQSPHVFADVREHRLDPCSLAGLAGASGPRAPLRLLQTNDPTSTTVDRSNISNHRDPWLRRQPCSGRRFPLAHRGATAEGTQGQGPRHRVLALSVTIARARDFAPTPIASGTSCRGSAFSLLSGRTRREGAAAAATHACMA